MDSNPISDENYYSSIIEFITSRISIELERHMHKLEIQELKKSASTDNLTGLLNRNTFYTNVDKHFDTHQIHSLMFIDVDNFKIINDTKGHQYGDKVLKHISISINSCIRNADILARFGGEEFVVFLPNTDSYIAQDISKKIHSKFRDDDNYEITVSIGLTTQTDLNESIEDLIKRADDGVYKAKALGKNQTKII